MRSASNALNNWVELRYLALDQQIPLRMTLYIIFFGAQLLFYFWNSVWYNGFSGCVWNLWSFRVPFFGLRLRVWNWDHTLALPSGGLPMPFFRSGNRAFFTYWLPFPSHQPRIRYSSSAWVLPLMGNAAKEIRVSRSICISRNRIRFNPAIEHSALSSRNSPVS